MRDPSRARTGRGSARSDRRGRSAAAAARAHTRRAPSPSASPDVPSSPAGRRPSRASEWCSRRVYPVMRRSYRLPSRVDAARALGDERCNERRPARLMRGAESFSRLAVEILVEEQLVAPRWVVLEKGGGAPDRPTTGRVGKEEPQEAPLEVVRDGREVGLPSGARRELDGERVAETGV